MCTKSLELLAAKVKEEKDKAQGGIYDCRKRITEIQKEMAHYEGERDQADFLLHLIEEEQLKECPEGSE